MLKISDFTFASILLLLSLFLTPLTSAANSIFSEERSYGNSGEAAGGVLTSSVYPLTAPADALVASADPLVASADALVASADALTAPADPLAAPPDTTKQSNFKMVDYSRVTVAKKEVPLLSGYGIYTDICGMGMALLSKWGQYEVGAHLGVKGKFFPAVEVGLGQSNYTDERSKLHYNVHSPFFRIGLDYNLNKDLSSHNRYYIGVRYGFSAFAYDFSGPAIKDDHWGGTFPVDLEGVKGNAHWGEILFGLQTQIWKFVNLGWTARYRARLHEKQGAPGHAYYIPGYGKNGESSGTFGGTFNIIFEL